MSESKMGLYALHGGYNNYIYQNIVKSQQSQNTFNENVPKVCQQEENGEKVELHSDESFGVKHKKNWYMYINFK